MPELSDRRTWLVALAATGLTAALSEPSRAVQGSGQSALKGLRKVSDLLDDAGRRLVLLEEHIGAIREPERVPAQFELVSIQVKCAEIATLAEEYRLWLEGS
jgi:hypothetical protein